MLYIFIAIYFVIGLLGVIKINQKKTATQAKPLWIKFNVYLFLVVLQLVLIYFKQYHFFGMVLIVLALAEVFKISKSLKNKIIGSITTLVLGSLFCYFSYLNPQKFQIIFISVIIFDGFSQISGQLFGQVKLLPNISPSKTLEGLFGGTLMVFATQFINAFLLNESMIGAFVMAFFIVAFAFFGDILASFFKRTNHVKDFGNSISGHGGILDRFDALITVVALFFIFEKVLFNSLISNVIFYNFLFLFLFFIAEFGYHSFKLKTEITRKTVHIFSGVICLTFPFLLQNLWEVALLTFPFMLVLVFFKKYNLLQSVNNINRKSYGSYYFPLSIFICFFGYQLSENNLVFYYLPIAILTFSDGFAALFGKKFPYGAYNFYSNTKTVVGSVTFFCVTILMFYLSNTYFGLNISSIYCVFLAIALTITEAISPKGSDNITIPLVVLGFLEVI